MIEESSTVSDLWEQIKDSAGSRYLNLAHQRSFSLNVFQMNAVELMEVAQRVKDPNQGMNLMMQNNREAGTQAHRELNRHVHNFVSSALTLVEHTRVFMRKHYAATDLLTIYEKQVTATFAQSPVAQFVQGLRNYMLHRGMPNSSMFMKFTADPEVSDGSGTMETGVRYDTNSLLDWKEWKPVARAYLEQAGDYLDLHESAQEYLTLVNQFHGWLDATLEAHHQTDLQELSCLQARFQATSLQRPAASSESVETFDFEAIQPEFTSAQIAELGHISSSLLDKIRELHLQVPSQGFPTERPVAVIVDLNDAGPIAFWGKDESGEGAFMFIRREGKSYGLLESDYGYLDSLIDAVMKSTWVRNRLSHKFVLDVLCDWARERFGSSGQSFADTLSIAARKSIKAVDVWAPIANLEVEQGFDFGPVRIESITPAVMEKFRNWVPSRPEQEREVSQFFEKLKSDIQGYASVVVSMEAEPEIARERALQLAQTAVGLLRFFSPAASDSRMLSSMALVGAEYIPKSKLIVLGESSFALSEGLLSTELGAWRLSMEQIAQLKSELLDTAASLVTPGGLSEFALAIRTSLLTYSKGITFVDPLDRLRNCLSALEGVLLKHEMEPRAHSLTNRMGFFLTRGGVNGEVVKQVVQQVYWLQSQPQLAEQGYREHELMRVFMSYAHAVLCMVLGNAMNFNSKAEFVTEIDHASLSSQ